MYRESWDGKGGETVSEHKTFQSRPSGMGVFGGEPGAPRGGQCKEKLRTSNRGTGEDRSGKRRTSLVYNVS